MDTFSQAATVENTFPYVPTIEDTLLQVIIAKKIIRDAFTNFAWLILFNIFLSDLFLEINAVSFTSYADNNTVYDSPENIDNIIKKNISVVIE